MTTTDLIRIGTHDGSFHADDVLAVAILTTLYPNHQIVRTRDPDVLDMMDIVVDVGDRYDHRFCRYDHHMHNPPTDKFDHILSSAGLIWRHYGRDYLRVIGIPALFTYKDETIDLSKAVSKHIRTHWINPIDRADNGLAQGPTTISEVVRAMRPIDPEKSRQRYNELFLEAVSMVSHLFKRSCFHSADYIIAKAKCSLEEKTYRAEGKIVISQHPVYDYKIFYPTPVHFMICPCQRYEGGEDYYVVRPILDVSTKLFKTSLPSDVLGMRRDTIERKLGVKGISYVHHAGHLALADTEEAAILLCEHLLSLNHA